MGYSLFMRCRGTCTICFSQDSAKLLSNFLIFSHTHLAVRFFWPVHFSSFFFAKAENTRLQLGSRLSYCPLRSGTMETLGAGNFRIAMPSSSFLGCFSYWQTTAQ